MTSSPAPPPAATPSRRDRQSRIRRRVAAWTAAAFVAIWGGVYVQMRDGHDPQLGAGVAATQPQRSAPSDDAQDVEGFEEDVEEAPATSDASPAPSATTSDAPVTTSQS